MRLMVLLLSACLTASCVSGFNPGHSSRPPLETSTGALIYFENDCAFFRDSDPYRTTYYHLAVAEGGRLHNPLRFDFRRKGRTDEQARDAAKFGLLFATSVIDACVEHSRAPAEYQEQLLRAHDKAIVVLVEELLKIDTASGDELDGLIVAAHKRFQPLEDDIAELIRQARQKTFEMKQAEIAAQKKQ